MTIKMLEIYISKFIDFYKEHMYSIFLFALLIILASFGATEGIQQEDSLEKDQLYRQRILTRFLTKYYGALLFVVLYITAVVMIFASHPRNYPIRPLDHF